MNIKLPIEINQTVWALPTRKNRLPGKKILQLKVVGIYVTSRCTTILLSPAKSLLCYKINANELNESVFSDKISAMLKNSKI